MINKELISPKSIVIVGASNNISKPGGKILKNIIDGKYSGKLYVVNPKHDYIQGIKVYEKPEKIDAKNIDLAIIAIASKYCLQAVEELIEYNNVKAFIIISTGFGEKSEAGAFIEKQISEVITKANACLIGPNCIGILNKFHHSVFTLPIPKINTKGCDFISSSGATAVFVLESGIPKGLTFSGIYSVGNAAQTTIEDVLKYMDQNFDPQNSSKVKLLYIESISNPDLLLHHAISLIKKGCKIAAIKAGVSEAGSRAAASHTGAIANSDMAVDALFKKAGIVRCYSRDELTTVGCIFMHKELKGKNLAIVTHAGGPAVMLTDVLSNNGLNVPVIDKKQSESLLQKLHPGSSASNPIDILATGTAKQLAITIDYCDKHYENIDAIVVIYGSPGLVEVFDAYNILHEKMETSTKPIFAILPSGITAKREIDLFLSNNHVFFSDEVVFGQSLAKIFNTVKPIIAKTEIKEIDIPKIRNIIKQQKSGFINPEAIQQLLTSVDIPIVREILIETKEAAIQYVNNFGFPVVIKAVGPIHKTEINGVVLNINSNDKLLSEFDRLIKIDGVKSVMLQKMLTGYELFIGAKYEPEFGHIILCGIGGIFVEQLKDVAYGLAPLTFDEALRMIKSLKSYDLFRGVRGREGINENKFADILVRLSIMLRNAVEIEELDFNPLIAKGDEIFVVDSRIKIG